MERNGTERNGIERSGPSDGPWHQVSRLRGIKTAPASLESTVLCVAHGLDLFYTRLHPSRSYDMLDEEFSFLLLIVTLAALAAGAFVTQGLSIKKDMDRRWR